MTLDPMQYGLGALSGSIVGLALGMFGGGGSILAVPLMVYVIGVRNPHIAIGTSALAVAVNAGLGIVDHARHGVVKWKCAGLFSVTGVAGAFFGAMLGKALDGQRLLLLFAVLMLIVGALMFKSRQSEGDPRAECTVEKAPKVLGLGAVTGVCAGFFGIGGGFLIVPGLIASTGMPIINAIGSSLVAVCAFGLTTALSYAIAGLVSWPLAALFVVGGIAGAKVGAILARTMSAEKGQLKTVFAGLIFVVATYMVYRGWHQILA